MMRTAVENHGSHASSLQATGQLTQSASMVIGWTAIDEQFCT
jgi:hypothetical protein